MRRRIGQVWVRAGDWTKCDPPGRAALPHYFDCISVAALNSALKSLPGEFSGLRLLAIMYAAFRQIDPTMDTGADFSAEFKAATEMQLK